MYLQDWWTDVYCSYANLERYRCGCYKWVTGNYYNYVYGDSMISNIYVYSGATAGVWWHQRIWRYDSVKGKFNLYHITYPAFTILAVVDQLTKSDYLTLN
jgi:hypothetical protein